jgi:transposase
VKVPSVRSLTWSLVKDKRGDPEHKALVERLCQECPDLMSLQELAKSFFCLIRKQSQSDLNTWQQRVYASGLCELATFARGLDRDRAAVDAALSEKWSNGPTEGHVNRLKFIKRQGYGRASFELLKARVLPLAG